MRTNYFNPGHNRALYFRLSKSILFSTIIFISFLTPSSVGWGQCLAKVKTCPSPNVTALTCADAQGFINDQMGLFSALGGIIDLDPAMCGILTISDNFNPDVDLPCAENSPYSVTFSATFTPTAGSPMTIDFSSCTQPILVSVDPAPVPQVIFPVFPASLSCIDADSYDPPNGTYTNGLTGGCEISGNTQETVSAKNYDRCGGSIEIRYRVFNTRNCRRGTINEYVTIPVDPAPDFASFPDQVADIVICGGLPEPGETFITTNGIAEPCERNVTMILQPYTLPYPCGTEPGIVTLKWLGEDECTDLLIHTEDVLVNPAPIINFFEDQVAAIVDCGKLPVAGSNFTATNGLSTPCERTVIMTLQPYTIPYPCGTTPEEIELIWTGSDECDEMLIHTENVTVNPAPAVEWIAPTVPLSLTCSQAEAYVPLLASITNNPNGSLEDVCELSGHVVGTKTYAANPNCTADAIGKLTVTYQLEQILNCDRLIDDLIIDIPIVDEEDPEILNCPSNMIMNVTDGCSSIFKLPTLIAIDDCNKEIDLEITVDGVVTLPGSITIESNDTATLVYTFTDKCGKSALCEFTATAEDNNDPRIVCPSNIIDVCANENLCTWVAEGVESFTVFEDCGFSINHEVYLDPLATQADISGMNDINGIAFPLGTSTVNYIVTEDLDKANVAMCTFSITVVDCQAPIIICPEAVTNAICGTIPAEIDFAATISDNCDDVMGISIIREVIGSQSICGDTETLIFLFTATDSAGNISECNSTYGTTDDLAPIIIDAQPLVLECNGTSQSQQIIEWLNKHGGATVTNEACSDVIWTHNFRAIVPTCESVGTSTVTFTVSDECGNITTTSAEISIIDRTSPTILCPEPLILECGESGNLEKARNWLLLASALDNCSTVSVANDFIDLPLTSCKSATEVSTIVTFNVEGNCDENEVNCESSIIIGDTQKPVLMNAPNDLFLECGEDHNIAFNNWYSSSGGMIVMDECDGFLIPIPTSTQPIEKCGSSSTQEYTFTASDACGNFIEEIAYVHIVDTNPPVFSSAPDCSGTPTPQVYISSTEGAGDGSCTTAGEYIELCVAACHGCHDSVDLAGWEIEDDASNDGSPETSITIISGSLLTGECVIIYSGNLDGSIASNPIGSLGSQIIVGSDRGTCPIWNGGGDTAFLYDGDSQNGGNLIDSESTSSGTSIYEVPVMEPCPPSTPTAPNSETVSCAGNQLPVWLGSVSATDFNNCSEVETRTIFQSVLTSCTSSGSSTVYSYLFTAIDECENEAVPVARNYTVNDNEAPVFLDDQTGIVLSCGDNYTAQVVAWINGIKATDNCHDVTITNDWSGSFPNFCGDQVGITVTFSASDGCLIKELPLTITSEPDNIPPSFINCPTPSSASAPVILTTSVGNSDCEAFVIYSIPVAEDCNGISSVELTDGIPPGELFAFGDTQIEYTATDICGNSSTCEFTISVVDNEDPKIYCPQNDVIVCNTKDLCAWESDESINYTAGFTNCSDFLITNNIDADAVGNVDVETVFDKGETTVIYTIFDAINNEIGRCSFDVVVEDCQLPSLTCPPHMTVECNSIDNSVDLADWLATDLQQSDSCPDLIINDPVLLDYTEECGGSEVLEYIFGITDCGANTVSCISKFTIVDTQPPIIDKSEANNPRLECGDNDLAISFTAWLQSNAGLKTADTNSCSDIVWSNNYVSFGMSDFCGSTFMTTVIFTATDECGNSSSTEATFEVIDTVAPEFIVIPDAIEISCLDISNTEDPSGLVTAFLTTAQVTDNCDTNPIITHDYNGSIFNVCEDEVVDVIFTAMDACGNSSSTTKSITIIADNIPPLLDCPMGTTNDTDFYTCEGDISWMHPTPIDDCDIVVFSFRVTDPDGTVNGPFNLLGEISSEDLIAKYDFEENLNDGTGSVVSYYVEDACGSSNECSFEVNVFDDLDPYFADCPDMLIVAIDPDQCSAFANWDVPIAFDNCDNPDGNIAGTGDEIAVLAHSDNKYEPGDEIPIGVHSIKYIAKDDSDNIVGCSFDLIVKDTQCPKFITSMPEDLTVDCHLVPEPFEVITKWHTSDNCTYPENVSVTYKQDSIAGDCKFNYVLKRTWSLSDESNNTCQHKQKITVMDTMAPKLIIPIDTLLESCAIRFDTVKTILKVDSIIVDSLILIEGLVVQTQVQLKKDSIVYEVTPIFMDPTLGFTAHATDSCSDSLGIDIMVFEETSFLCRGEEAAIISRIYIAEDECGNITQDTQQITILDPNPPVLIVHDFLTTSLEPDGHLSLTREDVVKSVFDACFGDESEITLHIEPNYFNCQDIGQHSVIVAATDPCNNKTAYQKVIVNIVDNIAPSIIACPRSIIDLEIDPVSCQNSFSQITDILVDDDCNVVVKSDPALNEINAAGIQTIVVTATDASGNSNSCEIQANIILTQEIDFSTALACNDQVNISLNIDCWLELKPQNILENDHDVCTDLLCIQVKDSNGVHHLNFFDESDIGQPFKVRVADCNGSQNSCWSEILIDGSQLAIIEWPLDTSLLCVEPTEPIYHKTGYPSVINCVPNIQFSYEDVIVQYDQCSTPRTSIERSWTAVDGVGNLVRDTQLIHVLPFSNNNVKFPIDISIEDPIDCSLVTESIDDIENGVLSSDSYLHPDRTGLPNIFGIDIFANDGLCLFSSGYDDEVLEICDGSFEVLRKWSIRDVCSPFVDGSNPIRHTQVITVYDVDGPQILDEEVPISKSINPWECNFYGHLPLPDSIGSSCGITHFDGYIIGPGAGYLLIEGSLEAGDLKVSSIGVEQGDHWVTYLYTDECSNVELFRYKLTVNNKVEPVVVCHDMITVSVSDIEDDEAKVFVKDIDAGSYDPGCGEITSCLVRNVHWKAGSLKTLIGGRLAYPAIDTCEIDGMLRDTLVDKNGEIERIDIIPFVLCKDYVKFCSADIGSDTVVLQVINVRGLINLCLVEVGVIDTAYESSSGVLIKGQVETEQGEMIEDVEMTIYNEELGEFPRRMVTSADGQFAFKDNPIGFEYKVTAMRHGDYTNGVSTVDLYQMQRHILGQHLLDSPYKVIAADVNYDQSLTALDIIILRKLILGINQNLPGNSSWRFVEAEKQFSNIYEPWPLDETLNYNPLKANQTEENFIGIKIGDTNNSVKANSTKEAKNRFYQTINFEINELEFMAGEEFRIPIFVDQIDSLAGFQFTLDHEGLNYIGIESGNISMSSDNIGVHGSTITSSWATNHFDVSDQVLFTLLFEANYDGRISQLLIMNSDITIAEAYKGSSGQVCGLKLLVNNIFSDKHILYQNDPNPFASETNISFYLAKRGPVKLHVFNSAGKLVYQYTEVFQMGTHKLKLDASSFKEQGLYFYSLKTESQTETKRMIYLK